MRLQTFEMQTVAWCSSWHLPQRPNGCTTARLEVGCTMPCSWSMLQLLGPVAPVAMQMTRLQACILNCRQQQQYRSAGRRCCDRICTQLQRRGRLHMSRSPVRAASVQFLQAKSSLWQNPDLVVQFCFPAQSSREREVAML